MTVEDADEADAHAGRLRIDGKPDLSRKLRDELAGKLCTLDARLVEGALDFCLHRPAPAEVGFAAEGFDCACDGGLGFLPGLRRADG